ncbi:MAG: hypothetical protein HY676_01085 [Chloroflexi bacterium]|nr:hypothetical protein [Chloroflexota bacterium]
MVALLTAIALALGAGCGGNSSALSVLRTTDFHALAFSPNDSNIVFFGHHNGIMRSDDGGQTWSSLVNRSNFDAMALGVSRSDPSQVYLAGHDIFQRSTNGGASWQPIRHNLPGTDIHGFAMSLDVSDRLYAFVVRFGLFQSDDGGQVWHKLSSQLPQDIMALAAAEGMPEILYAGSMNSGVLKSIDGGQNWARAVNGLGSLTVTALSVDPNVPLTVYACTDGGLYKSTNGGTSWDKLPFPGDNAISVAVSPAKPQVVLAIAIKEKQGLVYKSEDGGLSWGKRAR